MGRQDLVGLLRSTERRPELVAGDRKCLNPGGFAASRSLAHQRSTKIDATASERDLGLVILSVVFLNDLTEVAPQRRGWAAVYPSNSVIHKNKKSLTAEKPHRTRVGEAINRMA
jgi:hypothetical protein